MRSLAGSGSALVLVIFLSSCLPVIPGPTAIQSPAAPSNSGSQPLLAATGTLTFTPSPAPSSTTSPIFSTPTFTAIPTFTSTANPEVSGTPSASAGTSLTPIPGDSVSLDKLPANTVYGTIVINNNAGTDADISLHCTTIHGFQTVLEYNHVKHLAVQAPQGYYIYVVYVGSRVLSGSFTFLAQPKQSITIYKDRVVIQ